MGRVLPARHGTTLNSQHIIINRARPHPTRPGGTVYARGSRAGDKIKKRFAFLCGLCLTRHAAATQGGVASHTLHTLLYTECQSGSGGTFVPGRFTSDVATVEVFDTLVNRPGLDAVVVGVYADVALHVPLLVERILLLLARSPPSAADVGGARRASGLAVRRQPGRPMEAPRTVDRIGHRIVRALERMVEEGVSPSVAVADLLKDADGVAREVRKGGQGRVRRGGPREGEEGRAAPALRRRGARGRRR